MNQQSDIPQDHAASALLFFMIILMSMLLGAMIGSAVVYLISGLQGIDVSSTLQQVDANSPLKMRNYLRTVNGISHALTFAIPAVVTSVFLFRKNWLKFLRLQQLPSIGLGLTAIVFILVSFPFAQITYWLNQQIPLPDLLGQMEKNTAGLLEALLVMDSPGEWLFNLMVMALIPAVGEELIFRGLVQQKIERLLGKAVPAVWVTALIFSAVHLQFAGFIPRLLLGALLGYIFYWTRNLWVPILAHFFFNGLQVSAQYFYRAQIEQLEEKAGNEPSWTLGLLSLAMMLLVAYYLRSLSRESVRKNSPDSLIDQQP